MIETQDTERESLYSPSRGLPRVKGIPGSEIEKDRPGWTEFSWRLPVRFS